MAEASQGGGSGKARLADDMAATRTILAMDRTLLAWMRTALSLIGSGFALVKLLGRHALHHLTISRDEAHLIEWIGLGVMACGLACLLCGAIDYYKAAQQLRTDGFGATVWSRSMVMCLLLSALTLLTVVAIFIETLS